MKHYLGRVKELSWMDIVEIDGGGEGVHKEVIRDDEDIKRIQNNQSG